MIQILNNNHIHKLLPRKELQWSYKHTRAQQEV